MGMSKKSYKKIASDQGNNVSMFNLTYNKHIDRSLYNGSMVVLALGLLVFMIIFVSKLQVVKKIKIKK